MLLSLYCISKCVVSKPRLSFCVVHQAAEAEDDAYYQEFIAAMRRQQATADATPSSSEKSNVPEGMRDYCVVSFFSLL